MPAAKITAAIITRDRQHRLLECITSLKRVASVLGGVVVLDDASTPPLDTSKVMAHSSAMGLNCRIIRHDDPTGYIAGTNELANEIAAEYMLVLDDDAVVLDSTGLERAVEILDNDSSVAVVGFPQADRQGNLAAGMVQPSAAEYACYCDRFYGFAHLLRRSYFLEVGGYREILLYYGEEPDLSLRLHCRGYSVLLPDRSFAHVPEQAGRDYAKILRYSARVSC